MHFNPKLQKVTSIILKTVPVARIVLLAYINQQKESFSIFTNPEFKINNPAELHLFVLVQDRIRDPHAVADIIEQRCRGELPVTIMIMRKRDFIPLLNSAHPFAVTVIQSKQILYREQKMENIAIQMKSGTVRKQSELICWYKRAVAFREIARAQFQLGEWGMATFCVHQAAEQLLMMLMQMSIGYHVCTHNLDRHLRPLRFYFPEIQEVFRRDSLLQRQRFHLLKSTYIHFRYRAEFQISEDEVQYFIDELNKLYYIAEQVFYTQSPLLKPASRQASDFTI